MGMMRKPLSVKLFFGLLSSDHELLELCQAKLLERFGPMDMITEMVPWNHSEYYRTEMGDNLLRQFIFPERLHPPDCLPQIKREVIDLEAVWSTLVCGKNCRRINIDPGYLTEAKVVLSTTKDYSHRLYIGGNVYAEVELKYQKERRAFVALDHTYPDFRNAQIISWFNKAREKLHATIASEGISTADRTTLT